MRLAGLAIDRAVEVNIVPEVRKTDNITMRLWLETIENVVGTNGLKSILNYAQLEHFIDSYPPDNDDREIPVEDLRKFYLALHDLFGQKGARSLQLRIGREFIRIGTEKRPTIAKALKLSTRLLPVNKRISMALQKYAEVYDERQPSFIYKPRIEVKEKDEYFLLIDKDNFESEGISSDTPICNTCVGRLQYIMEWITGHPHHIEEIECRAMGHPFDIFKISKAPKK